MPRSPQGLYTLPVGNPVTAGTLIESAWANNTMDDVADALTQSLPRDGSAPMTGPLILNGVAPTQGKQAVDKAYVDKFIAFGSGMPIGTVVPYAGVTLPPGYLLCNGAAVSRTTYADLFVAIGVVYGAGDGSTTFNLPNLIDRFVRGAGAVGRQFGSFQDSAFTSHNHAVSDLGHTHVITPLPHVHGDPGHYHGVSDPGHTHVYQVPSGRTNSQGGSDGLPYNTVANANVVGALTGISIALGFTNLQAAHAYSEAAIGYSGVGIGATGSTETRPVNIAMWYCIKAVHDSTVPVGGIVATITSSDVNVLSVDSTDPANPILTPNTNVAFGMVKLDSGGLIPAGLLPADLGVTSVTSGNLSTITVDNTTPTTPVINAVTNQANGLVKLDSNNQIPLSLLPTGTQIFLGPFDCSAGDNPSEAYPTQVFTNGSTYIVVVSGTINVYDPVTFISAPTLVNVSDSLVWLDTAGHPIGWYYLTAPTTPVVASGVTINPITGITSTNVQGALEEINAQADTFQTAAQTSITAIPGLSATTVQTALAELETQTSSIFTGLKNKLLNGNFDIWQRGTTFTSTSKYGPDRWGHSNSKTGFYTWIQNPGLNGANWALQMSNGGVSNTMQVGQSLETIESVPLRGKVLTLSFWIKFSAATVTGAGDFTAMICERTSAADAAFSTSNYAEASTPLVLTNGSLPTVWTKMSVTRTISNAANNVGVDFQFANSVVGTDFYQLSQVQLEEGATPTSFEILPWGMQLNNCRYYYEQWNLGVNESVGTGVATSSVTASIHIKYVQKRKLPVISGSSSLHGLDGVSNAISAVNVPLSGYNGAILGITMVSTIQCRPVILNAGTDANQWIKIDADL